MAASFTSGTATSGKNGTAASFTFTSFAVSGSNPAIFVKVALYAPNSNEVVSSVVCSAGLTGTGTEVKNVRVDGATFATIWKIPAASGTGTITVTLNGSTGYQAVAELWAGTDQVDPSPTADADVASGSTPNPLSITVSNLTANDAVTAFGGNAGTGDAPNFDQTDTYQDNSTIVNAAGGYHLGTGAVSQTWGTASAVDVFVAARVVAAASGGPTLTVGVMEPTIGSSLF